MNRPAKTFRDLIVWQKAHQFKARFLTISQGLLEECRYYLILGQDLGYAKTADLERSLEDVSRLLMAYADKILSKPKSARSDS